MKGFMLSIICLFALSLASCGDDDVVCSVTSFNVEVNAAVDNLNLAITAFNTENTVANCEAVKDAAQQYLEAVQAFDGCDVISQTDYDNAVTQAMASIDNAAGC